MKTKFKNIRHYLPVTQSNYNDIMYNYLKKETGEQLYLGQHLVIRNDSDADSSSILHARPYKVFFYNKPIFTITLIGGYHNTNDLNTYGQHKIYRITFENDKTLEFKTNKFHKFYNEDRKYMVDNFFYEYVCIAEILNQLRLYVLRILDLPFILPYDKYNTWERDIDVPDTDLTHKLLSTYLFDAKEQNVGLVEKSEIENWDELNVITT